MDLHALIPILTWGVTQGVKFFLPTLKKKFPKRALPLVAIGVGVGIGATLDAATAQPILDSLGSVLQDAGYGAAAIGVHELGEAMTNKRKKGEAGDG